MLSRGRGRVRVKRRGVEACAGRLGLRRMRRRGSRLGWMSSWGAGVGYESERFDLGRMLLLLLSVGRRREGVGVGVGRAERARERTGRERRAAGARARTGLEAQDLDRTGRDRASGRSNRQGRVEQAGVELGVRRLPSRSCCRLTPCWPRGLERADAVVDRRARPCHPSERRPSRARARLHPGSSDRKLAEKEEVKRGGEVELPTSKVDDDGCGRKQQSGWGEGAGESVEGGSVTLDTEHRDVDLTVRAG